MVVAVYRIVNQKLYIWLVMVLATAIIFFMQSTLYAHPGNTASDGGHYCRTRCDYWGEVYGERHFHGGYSEPEYVEPEVIEPDFSEPDYDQSYDDYEYDEPSAETSQAQTESLDEDINVADSTSDSGGFEWGWLWLIVYPGGIFIYGGVAAFWDKWGVDIKKWWN